ncbi:MAG: DUF1178 family protein [Methylobacterium frigidaeris]
MIRYALACDAGHDFESWFPSSASYDEQLARGLVTCPFCDSAKVTKQLMAPALGRGAREKSLPAPVEAPPVPAAGSPPAAPVQLMSEPERQVRAMLKALHEHVARTADHVGERFAAEARRMHYGEVEERAIYGQASAADARALLEEGIAIQPLPALPDDRN